MDSSLAALFLQQEARRLNIPPRVEPSDSDTAPAFEIEVSDFLYVRRGFKNGPALRFTLTWKMDHPKYGLLALSQEGWLMKRNSKNKLEVSPPLSRYGPMSTKQFSMMTNGLHDLIVGLIANHKTKKGTSYADYVGTSTPEELKPVIPQEIDEDLPEEIRG